MQGDQSEYRFVRKCERVSVWVPLTPALLSWSIFPALWWVGETHSDSPAGIVLQLLRCREFAVKCKYCQWEWLAHRRSQRPYILDPRTGWWEDDLRICVCLYKDIAGYLLRQGTPIFGVPRNGLCTLQCVDCVYGDGMIQCKNCVADYFDVEDVITLQALRPLVRCIAHWRGVSVLHRLLGKRGSVRLSFCCMELLSIYRRRHVGVASFVLVMKQRSAVYGHLCLSRQPGPADGCGCH